MIVFFHNPSSFDPRAREPTLDVSLNPNLRWPEEDGAFSGDAPPARSSEVVGFLRLKPAQSKFKKICVFCGSNPGYRKIFSDAAIDLGDELVNRNISLVYGGGSVGLMGLLSQRVYDGGCHVLGVIPRALVPIEISGETVGEVKVVSDMHERKAEMAREAEAFIALPGGYGTMEELMEMITWAQLGIHKKPVGLLNVDGYYNALLTLFDKGVEEGFIKPSARQIVLSAPSANELLTKMEQYTPLHDDVAPRESWQMEQLGSYPAERKM